MRALTKTRVECLVSDDEQILAEMVEQFLAEVEGSPLTVGEIDIGWADAEHAFITWKEGI